MIIERTTVDKLPANRGRPRHTEGVAALLRELKVNDAIWVDVPKGWDFSAYRSNMYSYVKACKDQTGARFTVRSDRQNNRVAVGRVA